MAEEWREVSGFEGLYEVSSLGRVRRLSYTRSDGKRRNGFILRRFLVNGYPVVRFYQDGDVIRLRVHVLVAEAFLGKRPNGYEVNHKDGIKTNASVENLEYCTHQNNMLHAYEIGLRYGRKGSDHPSVKLNETEVTEIRRLHSVSRVSQRKIAAMFGVSQSCIGRILRRQAWGHIA